MSVINKMLRDLDARRDAGSVPELQRAHTPAAMQGTSSVGPGGLARAGSLSLRRVLLSMLLVLLLLVLALAWYLDATQPVHPPVLAVQAPPAMPAVLEAAPPPAAVASAPESAPEPVAEQLVPPASSELVDPVRKKKRRSETAVASSDGAALPTVRERQRPPAPAPASPPAAGTAPTPAAMAPPVPATAQADRRQNAALETLAQAQALWGAGSREAGLGLVQEAVATLERSQPQDTALLAQLVREQVRMELALGRPGTVLALLTRLEPALLGQADLWAVRGNAAQRLGRHPESVQAYRAALQLRPGEQRWMLGAAVSLAALGQLSEAATQAEQARALGPVSPEVLAYLRQAGVPLR